MNRIIVSLGLAASAALIAAPIFAEQPNRPSRSCASEIVKLCGRDRSKIPACLRENRDKLSESCANEVKERVQERRERSEQNLGASFSTMAPSRTVFFGSDNRQQIDIYEPEGAVDELPLVLHVHGGGWQMGNHKLVQAKPAHFTGNDYYFASTGYRLVPSVSVEEQAQDIGAAIRALHGQAGTIGFDRDRIVIMGHSAGAHLAALVATDPQYAGEAFGAIKGVILLDGAGYDVAASVQKAERRAAKLYADVFGNDAAQHAALSPVTHVGGKDAPNWLALYVAGRARSETQSTLLASRLTQAGVTATARAISDTDHGRMNRELGTPAGALQTQAVDAFLAKVFG